MDKREMERFFARLATVGSLEPVSEAGSELVSERESNLVKIEELFGHRFPSDYRWLQIHAPDTRLKTLMFHNVDRNCLSEVGCNLPLRPWTHQDGWIESLSLGTPHGDDWDRVRSWFSDLVPIGHDDGNGHNYLCYDFRFDRRRPPILRFQGEVRWPTSPRTNMGYPLEYVAPSLTSYLGLPYFDGDNDPYCEAPPPAKPTAKALAWISFRDALCPQPDELKG